MNTPHQQAAPGSHYSDGRRWSHISNAWILLESWNDREEIAYLKDRLQAFGAMEAENQRLRNLVGNAFDFLSNTDLDDSFNPPTAKRGYELIAELDAELAKPKPQEQKS